MSQTRRLSLGWMALLAASICCLGQAPACAPKPSSGCVTHSQIYYVNRQFGFRFTLPPDWTGYTILLGEWGGDWNGDSDRPDEKGPILSIRHPGWTEDNPWQDIPIMIFTHAQWRAVDSGALIVSAAPFGPQEIGRNRRYVFALPPRYLVDENKGYEDVLRIMQGHPLHALR